MRKELHTVWASLKIVRKRLFLRSVKDAWFQDVDHATLDGSITILYAGEDEMAGLKVVNNYSKLLKKEGRGSLSFLWAWMEKDWKDGDYISELANVPSKEELLSKLVYLLNYPVQSFAATLNQIADKVWDKELVSAVVEEKKEEVSVSVEVIDEVKPEAPKKDATE